MLSREDKIKSTIFALKKTTTATISIFNMPQMIVTFSLSPSLLPIALSLLLLKLSLLWLLLLLLVLLNLNCCHWLLSRSTQKQVRCSNKLGTGWIWEAQLFNGASSLFIWVLLFIIQSHHQEYVIKIRVQLLKFTIELFFFYQKSNSMPNFI